MLNMLLLQCLFFSWVFCARTLAQDVNCRVLKFNPPVQGHSLQGHVIQSFKVRRESACEAKCFVEHNCKSYNIGPLNEDETRTCELSDADHQMHPDDLVRQNGFTYTPTENTCSKNPCSPNLLCQNGFTDKGYRCITNTLNPKVFPSATPILRRSSNPKSSNGAPSLTSPERSKPASQVSAISSTSSRTNSTASNGSTPSASSSIATSIITKDFRSSTQSSPKSSSSLNVPPSVTVDSQSKTIEEGGDVTFICNGAGQPQPDIAWSKSEGSLPASRTAIHDATLTIRDARVDDSGLYVCTANNSVGSNSSDVELKVIRLSINILTFLHAYVGQYKTILCPVPTDQHPVVIWMYSKTSDLPDGVVIDRPKELKLTSAEIRHNGNYTCVVQNSSSDIQSTARVTVHIGYPETCSKVKANITDVSGHYVIDPDGVQGLAPFDVYCNMTDKDGIGVTVVSHDSEKRTHVNGCDSDGCYRRDVTYIGASLSQLTALTAASARCEQFISFECKDSKLFRGGKAWWVSRDGAKMDYWGGATDNKDYCACGLTNTCARGEKCNCDADEDIIWREDSGLLTDKLSLPVSQLRFGDTGGEREEGYHILGKLICYGRE